MFGCVYVATNKVNGKQYVGLTKLGVSTRWAHHIQKARDPKTYFHRAVAKYGESVFEVQPFASALSLDLLPELEQLVIKQLAPVYNQTNGGEITKGRKYDDATKERIRLANTGKKRSDEQCKRISEAKKRQYLQRPESFTKSLNALLSSRALPHVEAKRIASVRKAAKERIWSKESRKKLSDSCKGRRYGQNVIDKMIASKRKPVRCITTGAVYPCTDDAAKACGVSSSSVYRVCHGVYPSVKGLSFSFLE